MRAVVIVSEMRLDRFHETYFDPNAHQCIATNPDNEDQIAQQPTIRQTRAETLITVLKILLDGAFISLLSRCERALDHVLKARVDIALFDENFFDDSRFALHHRCAGKTGRDVAALCAPGYVVPVVEGVNHQHVDVRAHEDEVLRERVEHVPGIEIQERRQEVEAVDGDERHDDETCSAVLSVEETVEEGVGGSRVDLVADGRAGES